MLLIKLVSTLGMLVVSLSKANTSEWSPSQLLVLAYH